MPVQHVEIADLFNRKLPDILAGVRERDLRPILVKRDAMDRLAGIERNGTPRRAVGESEGDSA